LRIEWHLNARADLTELIEYIAVDNVDAAYGFTTKSKRKLKCCGGIRKPVAQVECQAPVSWWRAEQLTLLSFASPGTG
jgi:hypothetical protein